MFNSFGLLIIVSLFLTGCNPSDDPEEVRSALKFNEFVSSNDGVSIDEEGQTEDWLELLNTSDETILLDQYSIADSSDERIQLPSLSLAPGAVILFWADDDEEDGMLHLPFKLSASGEALTLYDADGKVVERVVLPELEANQAFARFSGDDEFVVCRYASPNKLNGDLCAPPKVASIDDDVEFIEFDQTFWPQISPISLGLNELALFPASFIEIKNFSSHMLDLSDFAVSATAYGPNTSTPSFDDVATKSAGTGMLEPGGIVLLSISDSFLNAINEQPYNEGVITLFNVQSGKVVDFVPFMHWPSSDAGNQQASVLARGLSQPYSFRFCKGDSQGEVNNCDPVLSRDVGNRLRGLYTPNDFSALSKGSGKANIESVKFVIDLEKKNAVHLLGAEAWALHYTFVRQVIDNDPELDRCDASENREFNNGWYDFSVVNYFSSVGRRFHLGTFSKHANADLSTVEFTFGDEITSEQMKDAFYTSTAFTESPYLWHLRPQDDQQVLKARNIESELPIVSPKAPFKDIVFQGLAPGVAYGVLKYVETQDLANASLGNKVIVITNDVPNDIDFVAGLITEAFQTPLAHVNILSQSRNTPNMALPNASTKPEFVELLGKLVRLEVTAGGYSVRTADASEAQVFWDQQMGQTPVLTPRLDADTSGLIDLLDASFDSLPTIGAKAAQMSELFKVDVAASQCSEGGDFAYPVGAFAIPMSYYVKHFQDSGADDFLTGVISSQAFEEDLAYRKQSLASLRQMIIDYPVSTELLSQVESWVGVRYGDERVRFRSSSNTEDLADFNGAGLYESISGELGSSSRPIDVAIKTVWASLWNLRAYEERVHANVDQSEVAMAVLVHAAFTNERANGVAVGRNILDPTRVDQFYFNSQAGEASVTNPAPGVVTEQLIYQWPPRTPVLRYQSLSSLIGDVVINEGEVRSLACALDVVQEHFRGLLDPLAEDRWFTIEAEFKFLGEGRELLFKQARPYQFGRLDVPSDCRENI